MGVHGLCSCCRREPFKETRTRHMRDKLFSDWVESNRRVHTEICRKNTKRRPEYNISPEHHKPFVTHSDRVLAIATRVHRESASWAGLLVFKTAATLVPGPKPCGWEIRQWWYWFLQLNQVPLYVGGGTCPAETLRRRDLGLMSIFGSSLEQILSVFHSGAHSSFIWHDVGWRSPMKMCAWFLCILTFCSISPTSFRCSAVRLFIIFPSFLWICIHVLSGVPTSVIKYSEKKI
jgi:hypothetical protein